MKNIFNILEEEKNRILEMHEGATKQQYLGVISEQSSSKKSSYTTSQWNEMSGGGGFVFGFPKGTVFSATKNPGIVTSKTANVYKRVSGPGKEWKQEKLRVSFYCKKGKFYIQNYEMAELYNETLGNALVKYVCGYNPNSEQNQKTVETPKVDNTFSKFPCVVNHPNAKKVTLKDGSIGYVIGSITYYNNGRKSTPTGGNVTYTCDDKEFVAKTPSSVVAGGGGAPRSSGSNVSDINTQIQQSLGNQAPTGQITDADIDLILTKLG